VCGLVCSATTASGYSPVPVFQSCGCARYITRDSGICSSLRVLRLQLLLCVTFGQEISLTHTLSSGLSVHFFHIISGASTHVFGIQVLYFAIDRSMMLPFVPHKEDAFLLVVSVLLLVASLARQITKTCAFCRMWCLCLVLFCLVLNWHGLFMIWSAQFCSGCQFGKASAIRIGLQIRIWVCCRSQDGAWELISKSSHHRFRSRVLNKCSSWMNLAFVLVTADSWIGMNHLEVAWCKPSLFGCTFPSVDLYILG